MFLFAHFSFPLKFLQCYWQLITMYLFAFNYIFISYQVKRQYRMQSVHFYFHFIFYQNIKILWCNLHKLVLKKYFFFFFLYKQSKICISIFKKSLFLLSLPCRFSSEKSFKCSRKATASLNLGLFWVRIIEVLGAHSNWTSKHFSVSFSLLLTANNISSMFTKKIEV